MARRSDVLKAQAEARAAEADAAARRAEAEARAAEAKARADAARAEAERKAEAARLERERQKVAEEAAKVRADKKSAVATEAAILQLGAMGVGMYAGHKLAMGIDGRFDRSMQAKSEQVKALGKRIGAVKVGKAGKGLLSSMPNPELRNAARAADKLKLTRSSAPLGTALAVSLIAEAAVSRFVVAPGQEDAPMAQAVTNAVATGSTIAAISLVGTQAVNRATPQVIPDAVALANIEGARTGAVVFPNAPTPPKAPAVPDPQKPKRVRKPAAPKKDVSVPNGRLGTLASAFSRLTGRAILPALATVAAVNAFSDAASAGQSTTTSVAAGGRAAATTTADLITGGAFTYYGDAKKAGITTGAAVGAAVARGVGAVATMGLSEAIAGISAAMPTHSYVPESVRRKQQTGSPRKGGAFLNVSAARRASAPRGATARSAALTMATGGPRGWANPLVQKAAQAARRRRGK